MIERWLSSNRPIQIEHDGRFVRGRENKGMLTALVVLVGICAALFMIIQCMPPTIAPHKKNELLKTFYPLKQQELKKQGVKEWKQACL